MAKKRINAFIGIVILCFLLAFGGVVLAVYITRNDYIPENNMYYQSAEYINPEAALRNEDFEVCDSTFIVQYYNPERATYRDGKNGLRAFIQKHYENKGYTDSGYVNIRFVINCKGDPGRYVIHQNDLNLVPTELDKDMVAQLFKLTTQLKHWNPNYTLDAYRDSYMYLSYRIEHGNITEIIP